MAMTESWRKFYEASTEPLDGEEFLVIYLDATEPEAVEQVLSEKGYIQSEASNVLGIKLGEYAFSECDLTQYPGEESIVDAIVIYHSLPKIWSTIDDSTQGLGRKKLLVERWFAIPSELIIDFAFDLLDELEEEARLSYP
jgi:hypothetical protein